MNKKFSSLSIVILLLYVQALSFMHIAKYGVQKHEHNGKVCEIFLNSEQSKIAFFDNPADNFSAELFVLENVFSDYQIILSHLSNSYSSRAPPIFS